MSVAAAAPGVRSVASKQSVWVVFSGLLLVMLLAALDQTIVSTALPTIVGDLGGLNHISWVVTAYLLAQTAVTSLYGKLGDQYGRKVVLQVALVVFLIGSAVRLRAPTPAGEQIVEQLVAERRASLARLCADWSPEQHRDLAGLLTRLARELAADQAPAVSAAQG